MENTLNYNLKETSKKIILMSLIVLGITIIMGMIFVFNVDSDFVITRTVWDSMIEVIDADNPGSGEALIPALFVGMLAFFGELALLGIIFTVYLVIPLVVNLILLIINILARLFQIGKSREWKNVITKVLLYISFAIQGILCGFMVFITFTGFGWVYIAVYVMLAINIYGFVKNIISIRKVGK